MSWLPRSIANSLLIDGEDEDEDDRPTVASDYNNHPPQSQSVTEQEFNPKQDGSDPQTLTTGLKEDLSEFTESLARQLWGVASFLAPPPPPPPPPPLPLRHSSRTTPKPDTSASIRRDSSDGDNMSNSICEDSRFGGETGVSNSSIYPNDNKEENHTDFVGVTDEVLAFAMNIAHHPETWLDFPLTEEEELDDFEMSDTQWNHASFVEHVVPRLAALRIELCPIHMSESYFWKVYFVLLHSRLNKHDARLLSTPQIVAARAMWMKELQIEMKSKPDFLEGNASHTLNCRQDFSATSSDFVSTTHHRVEAGKQPVVEKYETKGGGVLPSVGSFGDDEDDWIHENNSELDGYNNYGVDVPVGAHDDISFSDLEDDDCTLPIRSKVI
ncbi:unnamed protein product [Lactuca saligna]|uniref:BSD domain-containing protein n=1 Tax=Lactuca saligna TaxID=75948 RepID=A0AA36EMU7_LACSI|nr:unnamed protein product [Lactuca saligna]